MTRTLRTGNVNLPLLKADTMLHFGGTQHPLKVVGGFAECQLSKVWATALKAQTEGRLTPEQKNVCDAESAGRCLPRKGSLCAAASRNAANLAPMPASPSWACFPALSNRCCWDLLSSAAPAAIPTGLLLQ